MTPCVSGILYVTMTMELGGRVTIECRQKNFQAELEFKLKVALAAAPPASRRAMAGVGLGWCSVRPRGSPSYPLCAPEMVP